MTPKHMEGSLVFLQNDQSLLLRIRDGWQYLTLGEKLRFEDDSASNSANDNNVITSNAEESLRGSLFGDKKNEPSSDLIEPDKANGEGFVGNDINSKDVVRVSLF